VAHSTQSPQPASTPRGPVFVFSRFCLRYRVGVLIVTGLATIYFALAIAATYVPRPLTRALALPAHGVRIDASTRAFVLKNDPDHRYYDAFRKHFGNDTKMAVGIDTAASCFDEAALRRLLTITRDVEALPSVKRVLSLATVVYPTADGRLSDLAALLEHDHVAPAELAQFESQMRANSIVSENLVTADNRTCVLFLYFLDDLDDEEIVARGVLDQLRAILERDVGPHDSYVLVGNPVLRESLAKIISSDLFIFLCGTQILAAAAVFAIFRSLRTVAVIMVFVWITLACTFGVFVLSGQQINLVSAILSPLLITVCVTIAVHIFVYYNEEGRTGSAKRDAVLNTVYRMGRPCFLTSLTTAIGLGSLAVNRLGPVQSFGVFGAFGTMLSFVLAFALLPIALMMFRAPVGEQRVARHRHPVLQVLGRFSRVCVTHPWTTLIVAAAVAAAAVLGVTRLRVETRIVSYFKQREPIVKAYNSFDRKGLGITSIEVMITSPEPNVDSPKIRAEIDAFDRFLRNPNSDPVTRHVASVISYVDYEHERDRIQAILTQHNRLRPADVLRALNEVVVAKRSFVSADGKVTRINVRLTSVTSRVLVDACRMIDRDKGRFFDTSLDVRVTGGTKLYTNVVGTLVTGQIRSIVIAFIAITIVMAVVFRSLKIGLISMVPTALPVLITLGMMGWTGIALNGATVMIASVAIGIVVDSTIHFLHRYRREYIAAHDFQTAISRTLLTVGQPISYAVLILSCAFIILAFGNFNPTNYFGIMTAFTMLISLVITLLLLPVCLNLFHFRFQKNLRPEAQGK
jgi:predicted RND superfamily exporter protein